MFGLEKVLRRYPVQVQVLEKRGNAIQITKDKACRVFGKDDTQYYYLKKNDVKIQPPEYKYLFVNRKGKPILFLYSPQQGQFVPINLVNPPDLMIEDKELTFWNILQTRKTYEIYPREKSWLEKYASFLILGFTATIMLLIVIFSMNALASVAGAVSGISAQLSEVAKMLTGWSPVAPGT